jgi:hypothetical protein
MSNSHEPVPSPRIHGTSPACTRLRSFHALMERYCAACLVFNTRGMIIGLSVIAPAKVPGSSCLIIARRAQRCPRCSEAIVQVPGTD